jgi:hypothetical protein
MLEAPTGTTYVAVRPHVIGMTLIEPGGHGAAKRNRPLSEQMQ